MTVCVGLALGGCGKKKGGGTAASYTARAKIEAIDGRELTLRHEAIPNFVNAFGDKVTMDSMAMPFAAGEGVAIDGLAVGDLVEVRFHTDWDKSPTLRIDAISKLPAGTKLAI
ncbi:MAG TPA: copper-binding protein [Kofleriaceae bacterium]|nr:copper-binding protein [Kofleriaceae bacterium]